MCVQPCSLYRLDKPHQIVSPFKIVLKEEKQFQKSVVLGITDLWHDTVDDIVALILSSRGFVLSL